MRDIRLRDSISNCVVRVFRQVNRAHNKVLKPFGLSSVQAHILGILWTEGPMTIGELQRLLSMGSSTLTGAIDRMEKQELVAREPVPGDRRAYRLVPATWPKKRRERLFDALGETEDACFSALSAAERRTLLSLMRKVTESLD